MLRQRQAVWPNVESKKEIKPEQMIFFLFLNINLFFLIGG